VVLDLDGTLVDSVYQHVVAWQIAFHEVGLRVGAVPLHDAIGMGGDRLVTHVAGEAAERAVGDQVRKVHDERFRAFLREVSELDGASELLRTLTNHGHQLVVASSSEADLADDLLEKVDARGEVSRVVSGSDAPNSKPAPDLIEVAVKRAGGGDAVVIGDAVWDGLAATAAGLPFIGLLSGGISASRLREAGAVWVYDGARDLVNRLKESPLSAR
jgi:HAD superfamily hydrolase (TIGR01549 family)